MKHCMVTICGNNQGPISVQSPETPLNTSLWHLICCLKLLCSGQRSTVSSPHPCEETEHWPQNKFPFNVQTSKSTCPRCFVRLLPLSGPHPLTPVISLSALQQTSLPDAQIDSGCLCRSHSDEAESSRDEGKVITCAKWLFSFLPLIFSSQFY